MAAVTPLLSTNNLSKSFGGLRAVHLVDFSLPEGQVRALIGPNGAGKTTFVSLLCGRHLADDGEIRFRDEDITSLPAHMRIRRGMAYTFQITSIFTKLTLLENVALALRRRLRGKPAQVRTEALQALDQVGIADRAMQIAGDLSYGHQRLLEIAMGLAQTPRLLILDEPTQGLADSEIEDFKALIGTIAGQTTVLLIEHNMDVVMQTAEFITVMDAGEILAEGSPDAIRANAAVQAAYLGTA